MLACAFICHYKICFIIMLLLQMISTKYCMKGCTINLLKSIYFFTLQYFKMLMIRFCVSGHLFSFSKFNIAQNVSLIFLKHIFFYKPSKIFIFFNIYIHTFMTIQSQPLITKGINHLRDFWAFNHTINLLRQLIV